MKIYAIRDRLIDYFQQPWAAPGDKEVMTAIAAAINNGENNSAIAQAPHHFEIWRIGEVDEQGHITPSREFLGDCSSLIRGGVRGGGGGNPREEKAQSTGNGLSGPPSGLGANARPETGTAENSPHAASRAGKEALTGHPGSAEVRRDKPNY